MRRPCRIAPPLVALAAWAALTAVPAAAAVTITAQPSLYPKFARTVTDYVSRCTAGKQLAFTVHATGGEKVAVGSHPARGGDFQQGVSRSTGQAVTLRISSSSRPGTYPVRCLPQDFPKWDATRSGTPQAAAYVVTPIGHQSKGYVAIFDNRAVPIWWRYSGSYGPWDAKPLAGGTIAWTHYLGGPFGAPGAAGYEEHQLGGKLVRRYLTIGAPTDTHELRQLPNGDVLLISYVPRTGVDLRAYGGPASAKVYDGLIQQVDRSGKVVWSWSSKDHIALPETGRWYAPITHDQNRKSDPSKRYWDLVHLNSVEPDGDGFIVSARHLDAVFRIDKTTGQVVWKLGGTTTATSLTVKDDPLGGPHGQHDARRYGDGTVTVFDNETLRNSPPRDLRYRIDIATRTATLVESHQDSRVPESVFGGSARKLPGGDWVTYWGGSTLVTETTATGKPRLAIDFHSDRWGYRAVPLLPGQIGVSSIRRGMDRMQSKKTHRAAQWR